MRLPPVLKEFRVSLLLFTILVSVILINPFGSGPGVNVAYVEYNSSAWGAGLKNGMRITEINTMRVDSPQAFAGVVDTLQPGSVVNVVADKKPYSVYLKNITEATPMGLEVRTPPATNLRLGLDLQGGTRVIVKPVSSSNVSSKNVTDSTKAILSARMNTYGLSDVTIRNVQDYSGNWLLQVEMAGAGSDRILEVVKHVGKFDVRILNETVFSGDEIATVGALSAKREGGYGVPFTVKTKAAQRLADSYRHAVELNESSCYVESDCSTGYACTPERLCHPRIEMILDGRVEFSAPADISLHKNWIAGVPEQEMIVSVGNPEESKRIEAVMRSGTLPEGVERLDIISKDFVDPTLGRDFIQTAIFAGIMSLLVVAVVLFIRYRSLKISGAISFTAFAEVVILLGAAALLGQDLDLPSIAGIIVTIGTSVDQQIIITDELLHGRKIQLSGREQLKRAFSLVFATAGTMMATMFPLMVMGMGLVKGFAIMTFLGVLFGITITRPAYARVANYLFRD